MPRPGKLGIADAGRERVMVGAVALDPQQRSDLEAVLQSAARSDVAWLSSPLARLLRRPGKRLRPALLLASAACGGGEGSPEALRCAAAVELLHQSSLVHDDLMDGSTHRGDDPTLHATNGSASAVIGGDYLLAVGGRLISEVGSEAIQIWHQAYVEMCEGQARESANRYRVTTPEEYFLAIRGKTASLIRASCHLGGLVSGLPARDIAALVEFGTAFGMLFQLIDDVMDVVSSESLWGKPVQHDVGQGVYTLPVLTAARSEGSPLRGFLGPGLPGAAVATIYEITRERGVAHAVDVVTEWLAIAERALRRVPGSPARDRLSGLARGYVTTALRDRVAPEYRGVVPSRVAAG